MNGLSKILRLIIAASLALQPALASAQVAPDPNATNRPEVIAAPNGVPVINIVAPNDNGLSHNKYNDFNVNQTGLILNNLNQPIGTSQLGGVISGNPNLRNTGTARVILNEVTSTNRSSLLGAIEVFGGRADVIIANPNGITCSGCGFINTPRATLTTGVPYFNGDGSFGGFRVEKGDVTIGTNGLNVAASPGTVDLFDIVSRSIRIDGSVYAKNLRLTAGTNKFDYGSGSATLLGTIAGTPEFAIDGTALGAMQAGQIRIVSTERGAGVRMAKDMAANAGELRITADGRIEVGNIHGAQGVNLSTSGKIKTAKVTSPKKVTIQSQAAIELDSVAAEEAILLAAAQGPLTVTGPIAGSADVTLNAQSLSLSDTVSAQGAIYLTASNGDLTANNMLTQSDLLISVSGGALTTGLLQAGKDITITNAGGDTKLGNVVANQQINITNKDGNLTLNDANANGGSLSLTAQNGQILAHNLRAQEALSLSAAQNITANSVVGFTTIDVTAGGDAKFSDSVLATNSITIKADALDLQTVAAGVDVAASLAATLTLGSATNASLLLSGKNNITATKLISAGATELTSTNGTLNTNGINSRGDLTITVKAANLDVQGDEIKSQNGNLIVTAATLLTDKLSKILAGGDIVIGVSSDLTNNGQIAAQKNVQITAAGVTPGTAVNLFNSATGLIYANQNITLKATSMTNQEGAVSAGKDLTITAAADVSNISGLLQAGNDLTITAANFNNIRTANPTFTFGKIVANTTTSFELNPEMVGLPYAYLIREGIDDPNPIYPGISYIAVYSDYISHLWSLVKNDDGTTYHAWTWSQQDGGFSTVTGMENWIRGLVPKDANGKPDVTKFSPNFIYHLNHSSGDDPSVLFSWNFDAGIKNTTIQDQMVTAGGDRAITKAGGNLTVNLGSGTLTNSYSSLEAGKDMTLSGGTLNNVGTILTETKTRTCTASTNCEGYDKNGDRDGSLDISEGATRVVSSTVIGSEGGVAHAGGKLNLSFATVNNTAAQGSIAGGVSVAAPTNQPDDPLAGMTGVEALYTYVDPALGTTTINRPDAGGAGSPTYPNQSFMFETRAEFLDVGKYYGSSYFLNLIDYKGRDQLRFLGDAYFDNQLVERQLRDKTGAGFAAWKPGEDLIEQMRILLDKGADFAKTNHLTIGERIAPTLLASLTTSMVWYEKKKVNNVEVLVPVVYLADVDKKNLTTAGAVLSGNEVNIAKGTINNSGDIKGNQKLTIDGANSIMAEGGTFSGGDITLKTTGDITLKAQALELGGATIIGSTGGISSTGTVSATAGGTLTTQGAQIVSTGDLSLSGQKLAIDTFNIGNSTVGSLVSGKKVALNGTNGLDILASTVKAGEDLKLTSESGDINILARTTTTSAQPGDHLDTTRTQAMVSSLSSGGTISADAGKGLSVIGGQIEAKNDVTLKAKDDVTIAAAAETTRNGLSRNSVETTSEASNITSKEGSISITAGTATGDKSDIAILGSSLGAGKDIALQATQNVTIANTFDTSSTSYKVSNTKGENNDSSVKSSELGADGNISIKSGKDTTIVASNLYAGTGEEEDGEDSGNITVSAGGNLTIASATEVQDTTGKQTNSGFLSHSSKTDQRHNETVVGSDLSGTGNVTLSAGNIATISGSSVSAGKDIAVTADAINIIGAQETDTSQTKSKKTGLGAGSTDGFTSLYGKESHKGLTIDTANVGSFLSAGGNVSLTANTHDLTIMGSAVEAGKDINLTATKGDVNITPGAESSYAYQKDKYSGIGISHSEDYGADAKSGSASIGFGLGAKSDKTISSSTTNAVSSLSAGNDINITAGRDANLVAAQLDADNDVKIEAKRDVNLFSANDVTNYEHVHKEFFAGVTATVSSSLISAANNLTESHDKLQDAGGWADTTRALLPGIAAVGTLYNIVNKDKHAPIGSASVGIGFNWNNDQSTDITSTPVTTNITAGNNISIEAKAGSLTSVGSQISAGFKDDGTTGTGNILLKAGDDINLLSAQASEDHTHKGNNGSVGVNVTAGVSLKGATGFDLAHPGFNISASKNNWTSSSTTQVNTQVVGTGTVTLDSGDDTTLKGATVSGKKIEVKVKGDLTIESVPDTAEQDANRASVNISGTLALKPPGIDGMVGKGHGEYEAVGQQSGLFAGVDGFEIIVKGNTGLVGGLIASTADQSKNSLTTGTLTFEDLDVGSHYKVQSIGGGITPDGKPTYTPLLTDKGSDSGSVLSAIAPGTITITDPTHQTQDIGDLRRDTTNTNPTIDTLPDVQKLLQDQAHTLEQYKQAAEFLATTIGDVADKQREKAKADLEAAKARGDQTAIAEAQARVDMWHEGGILRVALHTAAGGLLGGINGLSGSLLGAGGGAVSSTIVPIIGEAIKKALEERGIDPNSPMGQYLKNLLTGTIVTGLTTAVTGTSGGGYGSYGTAYNYLDHVQDEDLKSKMLSYVDCLTKVKECSAFELSKLEAEILAYFNTDRDNEFKIKNVCSTSSFNAKACAAALNDAKKHYDEIGINFDAVMELLRTASLDPKIIADQQWGRIDLILSKLNTMLYTNETSYLDDYQGFFETGDIEEAFKVLQEKEEQEAEDTFNTLLDFTPVVGDIKGAYECGQELTAAACAAAVIGLVPGLGDAIAKGGKFVIKKGDELLEVTVKRTDDIPGSVGGGAYTPSQPLGPDGKPIIRTNDRGGVLIQPNGSVTCGQHSCGMVLNTMGKPVAIDNLISSYPPNFPNVGTTAEKLQQLLKENGVKNAFRSTSSLNDLKVWTNQGRPAIATVKTGPNTYHAVVIDGVTVRNGQSVVAIRDPGGVHGGLYYETTSSFMKRFTGNAIRILP